MSLLPASFSFVRRQDRQAPLGKMIAIRTVHAVSAVIFTDMRKSSKDLMVSPTAEIAVLLCAGAVFPSRGSRDAKLRRLGSRPLPKTKKN